MTETKRFDYVIVGAGSAGCALAARLAERKRSSVALLEAGPKDRNPWIHIPVGYYRTKSNPRITWGYSTEPEPELNGRTIDCPRGRVLGGSSSINGLLYVRGHPLDYDGWRQQGATGWAWKDMLPIFRRMENHEHGKNNWHGRGGPLGVAEMRYRNPLMDAYVHAASGYGISANDDINGPVQDGFGYFQLTLRNGRRCSSATAYGINSSLPSNLSLITDAQVGRVIFAGRRALGVELINSGRRILANREVVLCAGAIGSPQILELSGIGDPEILQSLGIRVICPNNAVGNNLQDHFQVKLVYRVSNVATINDVLNSPIRKALVASEYALRRTGLMTVGAAQVYGFVRVDPAATRPDMQIHAWPGSTEDPAKGMDPFSAFTSSVSQLRPNSRGSVHIRADDPRTAPAIRANYLKEDKDRQFVLASVKLARQIAQRKELAEFVVAEHLPGKDAQFDDEILDFIRSKGSTNYHPAGTCRIGPRGEGVVGPDLRVHGLDGLRVADASVMPSIVSGNTNAPAIAIGERLADILTDPLVTKE